MKTTNQIELEAKRLFRLCLVAGNLDESRVRLVAQTILESKHRGYLRLLGALNACLSTSMPGTGR